MQNMNVLHIYLVLLFYFAPAKCSKITDYWNQRNDFVNTERQTQLGGNIHLTPKEQIVNNLLMELKYQELDIGLLNSTQFLPALNFLTTKPLIEQSNVFQFIQRMPKGGVLHCHDSALATEDIYYSLTFMDDLYFCNTTFGSIRFVFADRKPMRKLKSQFVRFKSGDECSDEWQLLADARKNKTNVDFLNNYIKSKMTLKVDNPDETYKDINTVWSKFMDIFSTVVPIFSYRPANEKYWLSALKEYYKDNVMYIEFRGTLPLLYELNGTVSDELETAGRYQEIFQQFKNNTPNFHGGRFIYGPSRHVDNTTFDHYMEVMEKLHVQYPDFVAGFDLVGQEDTGLPLTAFVEKILNFTDGIKFFFHSGETNWYGETDLNLIDAVLLGTSRIGHGYAIDKHPHVSQIVNVEQIAVEVSPISNQVLSLVRDLRNHPAAALIAQGYPVVISNDDPAFWGAKGLSYDFYQAFMAFTSRDADIRVLKQLALNSIKFSAMPLEEQGIALNSFNQQWDLFIDEMLLDKKVTALNEIPYATNV